MACGSCGAAAARRAARVTSSPTVSASGARPRTRVRFFVVPPPESTGLEEAVFSTVYEARAFLRAHPTWFLQTRRVEV